MAAQMGFALLTTTIAAGQSLSPQLDIGAGVIVGMFLPASWIAANPTFQVSPDGGATWFEHYAYTGTETQFGPAASVYLAVDPTLWRGVSSLKVRSGTPGAPVVQTGGATITFVTKLGA